MEIPSSALRSAEIERAPSLGAPASYSRRVPIHLSELPEYARGVDCPICNGSMDPIVENDQTTHWLCWNDGIFPILCPCGVITGQDHDILCEKKAA